MEVTSELNPESQELARERTQHVQRPGAREVLAYLGTHGGCGGVVRWPWLVVPGLPGPVGSFSTVN